MKTKTAVAISGGVDSLVAAHLLQRRGHEVFGIHFRTGFGATGTAADDVRIERIAEQLGMIVRVIDLQEAFRKNVVDYFTATYRMGQTPNPCLICNAEIKFGHLLRAALRMGAERLATGHYARRRQDADSGIHLFRGRDSKKDQSYFLAFLNREQLRRACFPLGDMTKVETVRLAADAGLVPVTGSESQDVCFVDRESYGSFLAAQPGFQAAPGPIVDVGGRVIGRHNGLHLFTVGQRKGINCPAGRPYYVLRIDAGENRLVVGFRDETLSGGCRVRGINWICDPPDRPFRIHTRLRYRHRAAASIVTPTGGGDAVVNFEEPQSAVTPGQGAVFYRDDEVIGGGWIEGPTVDADAAG